MIVSTIITSMAATVLLYPMDSPQATISARLCRDRV